jgi:hypothetical protein
MGDHAGAEVCGVGYLGGGCAGVSDADYYPGTDQLLDAARCAGKLRCESDDREQAAGLVKESLYDVLVGLA